MRYKIMNPAMEGIGVGGNPVATVDALPAGDLNLSPSISIPLETEDLKAFCEKSAVLADQFQEAGDIAMVLEGIAARLDESSVKAEVRATRFAVECLCESVGIDKAELKGNEEGVSPEVADKVSIVLENIQLTLTKIWIAIRDGLRRMLRWIKEFLGGIKDRLLDSKKKYANFEEAYNDRKAKIKKGYDIPFNPVPYTPAPEEYRMIAGGVDTPLASVTAYFDSLFANLVQVLEPFSKANLLFSKMVESGEAGKNAGLIFDGFPDAARVTGNSPELLKNGFGDIKPTAHCGVYMGDTIGNDLTVVYVFPRPDAHFKDSAEMAEAIRDSAIKVVVHKKPIKVGPLPLLDNDSVEAVLVSINQLRGMRDKLSDQIEHVSKTIMAWEKIVADRLASGVDQGDAQVFSAIVGSLTNVIVTPIGLVYSYIENTMLAPLKYLEHSIEFVSPAPGN